MEGRKKKTGNLKRALESQTDELHHQKMHITMEMSKKGEKWKGCGGEKF